MEILFKAKRKDAKEWVEGYPFPSIAGKELNRMTVFEPFPGGTVVNTYEIDPETLCRYTGLIDKTGNCIFEDDILLFKGEDGYEYCFVIRFGVCGGVKNTNTEVGYIGFYVVGYDDYTKHKMKYGMRDDIVFWLNDGCCEVIGNIYDKENEKRQ